MLDRLLRPADRSFPDVAIIPHHGEVPMHIPGLSIPSSRLLFACALCALSVACAGSRDDVAADSSSGADPSSPGQCPPIETRPPNASDQRPAFPGQTRACGVSSEVEYDVV